MDIITYHVVICCLGIEDISPIEFHIKNNDSSHWSVENWAGKWMMGDNVLFLHNYWLTNFNFLESKKNKQKTKQKKSYELQIFNVIIQSVELHINSTRTLQLMSLDLRPWNYQSSLIFAKFKLRNINSPFSVFNKIV